METNLQDSLSVICRLKVETICFHDREFQLSCDANIICKKKSLERKNFGLIKTQNCQCSSSIARFLTLESILLTICYSLCALMGYYDGISRDEICNNFLLHNFIFYIHIQNKIYISHSHSKQNG